MSEAYYFGALPHDRLDIAPLPLALKEGIPILNGRFTIFSAILIGMIQNLTKKYA